MEPLGFPVLNIIENLNTRNKVYLLVFYQCKNFMDSCCDMSEAVAVAIAGKHFILKRCCTYRFLSYIAILPIVMNKAIRGSATLLHVVSLLWNSFVVSIQRLIRYPKAVRGSAIL